MKHGIIIACLIGLTTAVGVRAADESNAPPPPGHGLGRPMMANILPPPVLNQLALTADQTAKYNDLNESFKKEAAKLRASGSPNGGTTNSPAAGTQPDVRQALRTLHRSYVDKVRTFLTDDQKAKLDDALQHGPGRGGHGGPSAGTNPPPPAPPADK
jgi:hypothetical protein